MKRDKSNATRIFATSLLLTAGVSSSIYCSTLSATISNPKVEIIRLSPQWNDGTFHNTLKREDTSLLTILAKRIRNDSKHDLEVISYNYYDQPDQSAIEALKDQTQHLLSAEFFRTAIR